MGILNAPNELLLSVGEHLSIPDLYHFLLTCRRLSTLFIERLCYLGVQDEGKITALQWAAERGHAPLAELAISSGAEVNKPYQGRLGRTPLHSAAFHDHPDVVRILLTNGATIDARDSRCETPLHRAVSSGGLKAIRVLLEHSADTEYIKEWVGPAHLAASRGHVGCMKVFVDAGFDLNARGLDGQTVLHTAACESVSNRAARYKMVSYLLEQEGARMTINARDDFGSTALHLALPGSEMVRLLLSHNADTEARDKDGMTAAHCAAYLGILGFESLKALIDAGFDLSARDNFGQTILHYATISIRAGEEEMVEYLLRQPGAGAIINAEDSKGLTPVDWAEYRGSAPEREWMINLLARYSADLGVVARRGRKQRVC